MNELRLGWVIKPCAFVLGVAFMPVMALVWFCLLGLLTVMGAALVLTMPIIAVMKADETIKIRVSQLNHERSDEE